MHCTCPCFETAESSSPASSSCVAWTLSYHDDHVIHISGYLRMCVTLSSTAISGCDSLTDDLSCAVLNGLVFFYSQTIYTFESDVHPSFRRNAETALHFFHCVTMSLLLQLLLPTYLVLLPGRLELHLFRGISVSTAVCYCCCCKCLLKAKISKASYTVERSEVLNAFLKSPMP